MNELSVKFKTGLVYMVVPTVQCACDSRYLARHFGPDYPVRAVAGRFNAAARGKFCFGLSKIAPAVSEYAREIFNDRNGLRT